jgi:hypothetical protein
VVGLYLNPPLNAVVLSVDEKPSNGKRQCAEAAHSMDHG